MSDNNFGKCGPIFKFFSPVDSQENSLCSCKVFYLTYNNYFATIPCEIRQSKNVTEFYAEWTINIMFI